MSTKADEHSEAVTTDPGVGSRSAANADLGRWTGVLALALCVTSIVVLTLRASLPSDGTITAASAATARSIRIEVLANDRGLRADDVVEAVDGISISRRSLPPADVGDVLHYDVRRGGERRGVDVRLTRYPIGAGLARSWALIVLVGTLLAVATYVYRRRPADDGARDLLLVASLLLCGSTASIAGLQVVDFGGGVGWIANLVGGVAYILVWPALLRFALRFPQAHRVVERRPPLTWWVFLVPAVPYGIQAASRLVGAETPLARAVAFVPDSTPGVVLFTFLILWTAATNYRSTTDADTRRKVRVVAGAFAVSSVVYLGLAVLPSLFDTAAPIPQRFHLLAFLPCPFVLGFAILRLNLFDIDVAVRRSVVYASLSTVVVAVYAGLVGVASRVAPRHEEWAAVLFTGMVAVAISPLHQRMRRFVTRLIYGERDDPYAIVSLLGERLQAVSPSEILPKMVETLAECLRLPYVAIRLFNQKDTDLEASYGRHGTSSLVLPLTHRGDLIGELSVGERVPGEGFGGRDRRVLAKLTDQIALVVRYARLALDLQASRERLVAAREEERRRIRRDLHDGLGPALAATALQLQAAARLVRDNPTATKAILDQLAEEVQSVIRDIRRLVDDLRPPSIDQLGLVAAVEEVASRFSNDRFPDAYGDTLTVTVEATGDLRTLPAAAEVAAYRIVCEALNNAYRHGHPRACHVRLLRGPTLEIEVTDDGTGLVEPTRTGVGLPSMHERASELGGAFLIENLGSGGAHVWASLPVVPT